MRRRDSLPSSYFEAMFTGDADPWRFETSAYEQAKYAHTLSVLGPAYRSGFEIGCANGVLTAQLADRCERLTAVDVSETALARAKARCAGRLGVTFERMAVPQETPLGTTFDLILLSEVAYYWSDRDLVTAADRLLALLESAGDLVLVHWTGETDYPQAGDEAVEKLAREMGGGVETLRAERTADYRLDLWRRTP